MGSNRLEVAKFNCNQNKQNIFMGSHREVDWYNREHLVVRLKSDARMWKKKDATTYFS